MKLPAISAIKTRGKPISGIQNGGSSPKTKPHPVSLNNQSKEEERSRTAVVRKRGNTKNILALRIFGRRNHSEEEEVEVGGIFVLTRTASISHKFNQLVHFYNILSCFQTVFIRILLKISVDRPFFPPGKR